MRTVDIERALASLRAGELLVYPTETVYGLGVDIFQSEALQKLFALKGRPSEQAVSILVDSLAAAEQWCDVSDPVARRMAETYWPGPLTLVLPAKNLLPSNLVAADGTIGIRVSSHPVARELVTSFGSPISTTSANPSGQPAAVSIEQIERYFRDSDLAFLSGGDLPPSPGSTVVKVEKSRLKLLREGAIPFRGLA